MFSIILCYNHFIKSKKQETRGEDCINNDYLLSTCSPRPAGLKLYALPTYVTPIQCFQSCLSSSNIIKFYKLMVSLMWCFPYLHFIYTEFYISCKEAAKREMHLYKSKWICMKHAPLWPPHKHQKCDEGHHSIPKDPNWTLQEFLDLYPFLMDYPGINDTKHEQDVDIVNN